MIRCFRAPALVGRGLLPRKNAAKDMCNSAATLVRFLHLRFYFVSLPYTIDSYIFFDQRIAHATNIFVLRTSHPTMILTPFFFYIR